MSKHIECCWGERVSPIMREYHDKVWGKPCHDDTLLFKMLCLEGFQAGLTWELVLKRAESLGAAFEGFDPKRVAAFDNKKAEALLAAPGMIKHRGKIAAVINNARCYLDIQKECGSFNDYIWGFTDGKTVDKHYEKLEDIPAESQLSRLISKDLKKRGFKFAGAVIVYSFLQAVGIVNDHLADCGYR